MIAFLHQLAFRDFWLKLFSVALAVLVWFTISSAIRQSGSSTAPLALGPPVARTFSDLPIVVLSSARLVSSCRIQPETVAVTVEGAPQIVQGLQNSDIRVVVDLTGIETARDLRKRVEVAAPAGVAQVKVVPEQVQVTFSAGN